jgi:hypothetical protein
VRLKEDGLDGVVDVLDEVLSRGVVSCNEGGSRSSNSSGTGLRRIDAEDWRDPRAGVVGMVGVLTSWYAKGGSAADGARTGFDGV